MAKKITQIDPTIVKTMVNYNFPGNVREMRNMIERAIILSENGKLTMKNFSGLISPTDNNPNTGIIGEDIFDLDLIEKIIIMKALERTGYKKTEAAQLLNITRQALDRRLEKYDINL